MNRFARVAWLLVLAAVAAQAASPVSAQDAGAIMGLVVDGETGRPLVSADVIVLDAADSSLVASSLSEERGRFLFATIRPGDYFVRVSMVGHAARTTPVFRVGRGETKDLGALRLAVSPIPVDSVTVTVPRSPVTYEIDRTVYDVAAMGLGDAGVVSDALMGIPGLEVGPDGQVTVRGQPPEIYVNGQPAPLQGQSLTTFLEQFPAELIDRIEILHNPGASFAAAGTGGIVNIVLRRGVELGSNAILFLGGGTRGRMSAGGRVTFQKGALTLGGGSNGSWSHVQSTSFDLRQNLLTDPTTYTRRDGSSLSSSLSGGVDVDARYKLSERLTLSLSGQAMGSGRDRNGLAMTTWLDEAEAPTAAYSEHSRSAGDAANEHVDLRLSQQWQPRRHELNVNLRWQRGSSTGDETVEAATQDLLSGPAVVPPDLTVQDTRRADLGSRASVDYRRPWGRTGQLQTGFQADLQRSDDHRSLQQVADPVGAPAGVETVDAYTMTQWVSAAYASLSRNIGPVQVRGGVRAERTDLTFDVPGLGTFRNDYTNVFPSATLMLASPKRRVLSLSYSRRIGRPDAGILNPQNRSTDPLNRSVGNPQIEPRFNHALNLSGSLTFGRVTVGASPYWQQVVNGWAPITRVDSQGVSTRTYENLAGEASYGASMFVNAEPWRGWRAHLFVRFQRQSRDASNLESRYSGTSTLWSSQLYVMGRLKPTLVVTGRFSYTPPVQLPQGRSSSRKDANMGFRYQFLDRRASLSLSLTDPFDLARRSSTATQDVSYVQIGRSTQSLRSATFSFRYTFGGRGRVPGR